MTGTGTGQVGQVGQVGRGGAGDASDRGWVAFSGGELEGRPVAARCASCRVRPAGGRVESAGQVLCFGCHQAEVRRQRALKAAGTLETASTARFQTQLPFEPVNRPRLDRLRAARATVRVEAAAGVGRFDAHRRQAQIAARRAVQGVVSGVRVRGSVTPEERRVFATAVHAAELQLPESWLPFVVAR